MKVKELMTKKVLVLKPNNTFEEAAKLFIENGIDGAPVVDRDGKLISIVTKTDLMKAIFNKLEMNTKLETLDLKKVITINSEMNIEDVLKYNVGRLPVIDKNNKIIGIITHTDFINDLVEKISKKCRDMKNTKLGLTELDSIIECSYDGIYITDGEANTIKINNAYESITGLKRSEVLGRNMKDLEKEGVISQSATLLVLKNRKTTTIQQEFKTGVKVLVSSNPIFDKNGKIIMVVTNVRDVTQLYELKEQLQKNKEITLKYVSEIEEMRTQLLNTSEIVAEDHKTIEIIQLANRIAKVDTTILMLGETGAGKDQIAKHIHKVSKRSKKQFIKVNCGAVPASLIESEFFGYEKGAFTGANKEGKIGLFEMASGGTIFLDEVGELPMDMQVKLLRVLQEMEVVRIGGTKPIKIDVRVLAATNRDLEDMIKKKQFREDLYYRLNVIPLYIPPLRERKHDILPLINFFLTQLNKKYNFNKVFASDALNCMYEYNWPGNVRELKNIVERAVIMSEDDKIKKSDLPKNIIGSNGMIVTLNTFEEGINLKETLDAIEKKLIKKAYDKYGNVRAAAKSLGIDASTFVRKRQKYIKEEI
ncbi:MAG: sigma 54-interacting transcriptional regulator [Clostridium beijerinckii]|uniref:HTH-type transcriptional regulatory protein TyrR n=1 Tax=Clostridium diolis TaxID=223919 RepID=A0AAV3W5P9_9CLOT|nr:sigma 54-interacting transcriptional regulator [Clostridium diolis]MCI1581367.1 sigma 54-interacting transcriptional regulator [Clostridium beijerinckii]MCI1585505.1 sigma 54-interacting transcriptional regulator [Clostridium beijerinckii]MCI1624906.1 sigma 54-interacting transcriptional regulator [Clostridium beijerinckii]QES73227.1 CBS domain-containing protein [Clostridium diolis]GEA32284.1 PAS domain-containing protein [Clostridium diolis]